MDVRLRAARPADGTFVARVLEMAGRGHLPRGAWDFAFEADVVRAAALGELATAAPPSWYDAGLRAYERAGFAVVEERTHRDFLAVMGSPGFVRMSATL